MIWRMGITVRRWPLDCAKESLSDNLSLMLLSGLSSHLLSESKRHREKYKVNFSLLLLPCHCRPRCLQPLLPPSPLTQLLSSTAVTIAIFTTATAVVVVGRCRHHHLCRRCGCCCCRRRCCCSCHSHHHHRLYPIVAVAVVAIIVLLPPLPLLPSVTVAVAAAAFSSLLSPSPLPLPSPLLPFLTLSLLVDCCMCLPP